MEEFILRDDFIKLGQLLKAAGLVDSGVEAKAVIVDGQVKVNGTVEIQRGKKIHGGDLVEYNGNTIKVVSRQDV
ncbi:RNA-binding S4 domain-containing protein [Catenibacillus scindens]|uniref:RNA-binding S4 domain-containing protein n=1 Tax=Catenibacillus scindens TaxID=673271 RepID=UPI002FE6DB9B